MYKKQVRLCKWGYMANDNENGVENENISSWYDKNWPKSRHGHKYTKYKMRLSIKMVYMY